MLRTYDILGWIRIRIRGSMPLTNGSGSCYFRHWPLRCQQKTNFLSQFFLLITFWGYIYIIFQIKSLKESQNSRNQGFYYFCMMIEGSGSIPLTSGSGSGRPKNMWIRIRNTGKEPELELGAVIHDFGCGSGRKLNIGSLVRLTKRLLGNRQAFCLWMYCWFRKYGIF